MIARLLPVDVQVRDDAAVGAAIRRAIDALPAHTYLLLTRAPGGRWIATASAVTGPQITRTSDELVDALARLTLALEGD